MSTIKTLIGKLNSSCYESLERAASIAVARTHFNIELEHWLLAFLEDDQTTLFAVLSDAGCKVDQLIKDINSSLELLKIGNDRSPAISDRVVDVVNEAWLISSLDENEQNINSGAILSAMLQKHTLNQLCLAISAEFKKISPDEIRESVRKAHQEKQDGLGIAEQKTKNTKNIKTTALDQFTINLNEQARLGKIDAAVGREDEICQIIDILSRRRQNNAILTGEPGVGKTAIVEGLALRIVSQDVPEHLKQVVIHTLDLGLLQAGAGVKGEFENRLKKLIDEVKSVTYPIILFIDEAHMMIGAGASAGQGDAANLLKPALARGELRCIAATTWSEYKLYFEKDAALTRRFQVVKVEEPNVESAIYMLRSLVPGLEKHHKIKILDSALQAATLLSQRYISGRHLPDKSISVLDTACARTSSQQTTKPAKLEKLEKLISHQNIELTALKKEGVRGEDHKDRIKKLQKELFRNKKELKALSERWKTEQTLAKQIAEVAIKLELCDQVNTKKKTKSNPNKTLQKSLENLMRQLKIVQCDDPLIRPYVDHDAVAKVIADWTGIPVGRMQNNEIARMMELEQSLSSRIVGQNHALNTIALKMRTSSAKLSDPDKPIGVFLFVGPSGVGKTETALALAEQVYGSEKNISIINMSEFKEEHKISMLVGSPPGYVGYGEGGILTEAVRRNPYSIILLDEMEKAHSGVQELFYQVFDKGSLRDGQGRDISFKNCVIIMTSNVCSESIVQLCEESDKKINSEVISNSIQDELTKHFKSAFLGRVNVVPYIALSDPILSDIIQLKLARVQSRLLAEHKVKLNFDNQVIGNILSQCQQAALGARQADNIITKDILPALSSEILSNIVEKKTMKTMRVGVDKKGEYVVGININCRGKQPVPSKLALQAHREMACP